MCAGGFLFLLKAAYAQSSPLLNTGSLASQPISAISLAGQPTSLLAFHHFSIGIAGEKRFLLPGYGEYSLALIIPEKKNGFGISAFYGGSLDLHRTNLGLAYARQFGEKMGVALQFNYRVLSISGDYGNTTSVLTRVGFSFQLTPQLKTSIHISDPFGMASSGEKENWAGPDYSAAIGYALSEKCYAGVLIQKQESREPSVIADIIYSPFSYLRVHGGLNATTGASWLGICFRRKNFQFGLCISIDQRVGYWPVSTIGFESAKNPLP